MIAMLGIFCDWLTHGSFYLAYYKAKLGQLFTINYHQNLKGTKIS